MVNKSHFRNITEGNTRLLQSHSNSVSVSSMLWRKILPDTCLSATPGNPCTRAIFPFLWQLCFLSPAQPVFLPLIQFSLFHTLSGLPVTWKAQCCHPSITHPKFRFTGSCTRTEETNTWPDNLYLYWETRLWAIRETPVDPKKGFKKLSRQWGEMEEARGPPKNPSSSRKEETHIPPYHAIVHSRNRWKRLSHTLFQVPVVEMWMGKGSLAQQVTPSLTRAANR